MKNIKNIAVAVMVLGLFVTPALVNAETGSGIKFDIRKDFKEARENFVQSKGDAREEFKTAVDARKDALKSEFSGMTKSERKDKIAEMRTDVNVKLLARLDTFTQKSVDLFEKSVTRMNAFSNKVESLINRLEDKHDGLDLSPAKALLGTADAKIALITSSFAQLESDADAIIAGNESATEAFKEIKELIRTFKDEKVKPAHDALVEAVKAVKAGVPQND